MVIGMGYIGGGLDIKDSSSVIIGLFGGSVLLGAGFLFSGGVSWRYGVGYLLSIYFDKFMV